MQKNMTLVQGKECEYFLRNILGFEGNNAIIHKSFLNCYFT